MKTYWKKSTAIMLLLAICTSSSLAQSEEFRGVRWQNGTLSLFKLYCIANDIDPAEVATEIYRMMERKRENVPIRSMTRHKHKACLEQNATPGGDGVSVKVDALAGEIKWQGCAGGKGSLSFGVYD